MTTINVLDFQRDPPGFLRRVEAGETLVVIRDQHPVAEIKPMGDSEPSMGITVEG